MSGPLERLGRFTPDGSGIDRDALLFAAGRASVKPDRRWQSVAGLLALIAADAAVRGTRPRIALTAPTGKAAARLQEAVEEAQRDARFTDEDRERLAGLTASTMHRLLGWRPGSSTRFAHHRGNRLPHDVIVVDETSMVSLTMMARLLEAVRVNTSLQRLTQRAAAGPAPGSPAPPAPPSQPVTTRKPVL